MGGGHNDGFRLFRATESVIQGRKAMLLPNPGSREAVVILSKLCTVMMLRCPLQDRTPPAWCGTPLAVEFRVRWHSGNF